MATYGQYPEATFTPACSGITEQIVTNAYAGEYSNVNIQANTQYTFSSSTATDYITITNEQGGVTLASGVSPLIWSSGGTSGVIRYYFHTNSNCGSQNTNRIRYIQCVATQSCGLPTNLAVSNITSNSCRFTWNAPTPAASSYDIYVSSNNTAPVTSTAASLTSNSNIVGAASGLLSATTYYYWVRSNCNGTKSAWVPGGSFTTIATLNCNGAIYGLFPEATYTPNCSGQTEQITTDAWAGEYSNVNILANNQYTFTSSVVTDYITITNASGTAVYASGTAPLVWNSNATSGVIRYHLNSNANCGVQNSVRTKYIQCTSLSSCGLPTNLSVSNITSNSCRLFWNAPTPAANSYDIYLSTSNSTPQTTTNATQTSVPNLVQSLSGLTASTTYYYWVRSNCNGTKSAWVSGGSFTTISYLNCNGATYGLYPNSTFIPTCTGSAEQITTAAYAGEYSNVNILANKQYTFTSSIATDYITITNATGTTLLASGVTPLVWNSNTTSGIIRYHIHTNANCGTQNSDRVRSVKCQNASSCNPPTNFGSEVLSSTSAVIGWIPSTSAPNGGYLYVYNTSPTIGGMDGSTFSTTADLTDLAPGTTYYWWVASNCVTSQSDWAFGGSFTTLSEATGCWQTISAGTTHTLGVKADGTLWAWGNNGYGQIGDGTLISKQLPTQIGTSSDWQEIAAGEYYSLAIKTNGTLWAWGNNIYGQLGDGTTVNKNTPVQIGTASNWQSVRAGGFHTLAIKTNGTLWGWGKNTSGQLGDGTTITKVVPTQIGTATNWQSVAVGFDFSLAIKANGTLWSWGANGFGQLGDGTTIGKIVPIQIMLGDNWSNTEWGNVAAGYNHSVARMTNGILFTWGNNTYGQLGDSTNIDKTSPNPVNDQVQSIDAGKNNTIGITEFGNIISCGENSFGQLGGGNTNNTNSFMYSNSTDNQMVSTGGYHTFSINVDGFLSACGVNDSGQLGNNSTSNSSNFIFINCPTSNLSVEDFIKAEMNFYPNPVNDILNISFEHGISAVVVYNLLGQEVFSKPFNSNEVSINMSNLASGTYLVKVNAGDAVKTVKIIKQ
ncbi:fibronectin type III domain-containing protein [Flavobacterium soli]|uniref:fibronectin type III domain-containing protein n=1 Tax=Flavobacterium soli TaxID=344881 RepID=UPI0003F4E40A|nr:T9SS type A sorting domain-containing protein [Flavobacterium soli]